MTFSNEDLTKHASVAHSELSAIYDVAAKAAANVTKENAFELLNKLTDDILAIGLRYYPQYPILVPLTDGKFEEYTGPDGRTFYVDPTDVVGSFEKTFGSKLTDEEKAALTAAMVQGEEAIKAGMSSTDAAILAGTSAVIKQPGIAKIAE